MRAAPNALKSPAYRAGALALFGATAVILAALGFEYIGGYAACELCLEQRYAYYFAIPVLFLALILLGGDWPNGAVLLFVVVALAFLANTGLGAYHAGVEWHFWSGPETCTPDRAALTSNAADLMKSLATTQVIRCDEPAWRLAGLSFAGWNVLASFMLAVTSGQAAAAAFADKRSKFL